MQTIDDVHQQFAEYFGTDVLKPYTYLLSKKLADGHICLPVNPLQQEDTGLLPEPYKASISNAHALQQSALVGNQHQLNKPFVLYNNNLYLQRYFNYETILLNRINQLVQAEKEQYERRVQVLQQNQKLTKDLFASASEAGTKAQLETDWQLVAAINAVINNFTIITGGPGTGKTTTVAKILALLFQANPGLKVALAAPTGKAAARMADSLKNAKLNVPEAISRQFAQLEPSTIHRLLKTTFGALHFKHNSTNPIDADVVIVDESSMIDVALFAKLLDAIGDNTRLILLGDKDQLASVEAGSLFGDLCQALPNLNMFSQQRASLINQLTSQSATLSSTHILKEIHHPLFEHIVELRHSHRFSDEKGIGKFSKAIIQNDSAALETFFVLNNDEQVKLDERYSEEVFNDFVDQYAAYIKEKDLSAAFTKLNSLRVLCAIREGAQGLYAINKKIEDRLLHLKLLRRTGEFYEHRPIIVNSNNYELGLFNGDTGIIRTNEKGVAMAWFQDGDGQLKSVLPGYIAQADTVFAMTIHKSQGSEFKQVLLVLPDREENELFTRELLYTAVTRARETAIIQARKSLFLSATAARVKRASGIAERFYQ